MGKKMWSFLRENGFRGILQTIKKWSMYFWYGKKIDDEKQESPLEKEKRELFETWEKIWEEEIKKKKQPEYEYSFQQLFKENYNFVLNRMESNKKNNFKYKKRFIMGMIIYLGISVLIILFSKEDSEILAKSGMILGALIGFMMLMNKWIDIKKYQETWVRHENHMHCLEKEMLKFIEEIEPYEQNPYDEFGCEERTTIFIKEVLKIWDENNTKFVDNMENKEKGLLDNFDYFPWKQK